MGHRLRMQNLRLPIIKVKKLKARQLSMDDYLRFVITNLKYTISASSLTISNRKMFTGAPFTMK